LFQDISPGDFKKSFLTSMVIFLNASPLIRVRLMPRSDWRVIKY